MPKMSLVVVINGPVATAGSILNLLSVRGISVPKIADITITVNSATLTVIAKLMPILNRKQIPKTRTEQMNPLTKPTPNSFTRELPILRSLKEPFANP